VVDDELMPADGMSAAVEITGFRHVPLTAPELSFALACNIHRLRGG
jgi:hypothetical protein